MNAKGQLIILADNTRGFFNDMWFIQNFQKRYEFHRNIFDKMVSKICKTFKRLYFNIFQEHNTGGKQGF